MPTMADLSAVTNLLKYVYGDVIVEQANKKRIAWNLFPRGKAQITGKGFLFPVRYAFAEGAGSRAESETLPTAVTTQEENALLKPKFVYASLKLTGPVIWTARGAGAFVNKLSDEIKETFDLMTRELATQVYLDGWGARATTSAQATISAGFRWSGTCDNAVGVRYLGVGMRVDFYESNVRDTHSVGAQIADIDWDNKQIIMAAYGANDGETIASGAVIVRENVRNATHNPASDTSRDIQGLLGLVDDGTYVTTYKRLSRTSY